MQQAPAESPQTASPIITVSIVSHGQASLLRRAVADLAALGQPERFELILTRNLPEALPFAVVELPFPVVVIDNETPKGYGANHNAAFKRSSGTYFCVMNPDIGLPQDPFPALLDCLEATGAAVSGPRVMTPDGQIEDSIRRFPTPLSLFAKGLQVDDGRHDAEEGDHSADWIAGMFMVFRSDAFRSISGFDEVFFLYYEDVDLCARLWKSGQRVVACPRVSVIHDARRASRRQWRYRRWHAASLVRYLVRYWLRLPQRW